MTLLYADDCGLVEVRVDENGVQFIDGFAVFEDGDKEYRIPVEAIYSITSESK